MLKEFLSDFIRDVNGCNSWAEVGCRIELEQFTNMVSYAMMNGMLEEIEFGELLIDLEDEYGEDGEEVVEYLKHLVNEEV